MAPRYQRKDLAPTNIPRHLAQESVKEYFYSKCVERQEKKFPEWDQARTSPAAELVVARRQLLDAQEKFEAKLKEQQTKREELDVQWTDMRKKEARLRANFINFNRFIKENIEKRERADRKTTEEIAAQAQCDENIKNLKTKVAEMTALRHSMETHVNNYSMYENYLNNVLQASLEFQAIHDILNRFEALSEARQELAEKQENDLEALENARAEMIRLTEEKSKTLMGLNNQFAILQTRFEKAKAKVHRWQGAVNRIKSTTTAKTLEIGRVRTCCWNMYSHMCKLKDCEMEFTEDDYENQLAFIKLNIMELKKIIRVARKKASKEIASVPTSPTGQDGSTGKTEIVRIF